MNKTEALMGMVRHVLTFGGGYLIASGAMDAATWEQIAGALVTLAGAAWSVYQKRHGGGGGP